MEQQMVAFFNSLEPKDVVTALVAAYAAIVATLNFVWPRIQEWKEHRVAIFRALKGEKEAISEVAYKVSKKEWDTRIKNKKFRKKLISALSMAFALKGSDRAKAYVFKAFDHLVSLSYCDELLEQLHDIQMIYKQYDSVFEDSSFRKKRLAPLNCLVVYLEERCKQ